MSSATISRTLGRLSAVDSCAASRLLFSGTGRAAFIFLRHCHIFSHWAWSALAGSKRLASTSRYSARYLAGSKSGLGVLLLGVDRFAPGGQGGAASWPPARGSRAARSCCSRRSRARSYSSAWSVVVILDQHPVAVAHGAAGAAALVGVMRKVPEQPALRGRAAAGQQRRKTNPVQAGREPAGRPAPAAWEPSRC